VRLGIVDLDASAEEQSAVMAAACAESGFFRVPLASVPRGVADAAWDAAEEFFARPVEERRRIEFPEPGYPYGYSPFGHETLARSLGDGDGVADLKESLSVGPDCGGPTRWSDDEEWIRSPSLWPERPVGLRDAWEAYYRALSRVAEQLMAVMAVALELPADHFVSLIDRSITSMRAIHYPARSSPPEGALRAGAHTDYGTLTILRTDGVPGLQIEERDGSWVDVEHDPDSFVVNLGDSIAQWTNDRWRSTMHRVVPTEEERMSFAFFHMANWDAVIECLPTCRVAGEEPRHSPVKAGPWLLSKFQSTVM
jgi:isopenicillin N synthase-like dioxygenase